jgi:zinc/manganese transport system substrate-binding protein
MSHRARPGLAVAALSILALAACGSPDAAGPAESPGATEAAVTVVTSTNVYGAIAEAVGGERVAVESIIADPAADPHSYESTPADAATVAGAGIVVLNGGGYDPFMARLVEAAGNSPAVIDVVELSGLEPAEGAAGTAEEKPADDGHGHGHEGEAHSEEGGHGALNEHVWYHLPTVQSFATTLAQQLGTLDAEGAADYTANAEAFNTEVAGLIERAAAAGAGTPGARIALTEPLPVYLVEAAGLTDVTPPEFSEAVEEDTDPPAAVVAEMLALFSGDPVRALILNDQTQTPTTDQVRKAAEGAGVPVVEMSETMPEGQTDYVAWMGGQIDALTGALDRT